MCKLLIIVIIDVINWVSNDSYTVGIYWQIARIYNIPDCIYHGGHSHIISDSVSQRRRNASDRRMERSHDIGVYCALLFNWV